MEKEKRLTFRLLFYPRNDALRRDGRAPLMLRITVDGQTALMSLHLSVTPSHWCRKEGRMAAHAPEAHDINLLLDDVAARARQLYYAALFGGKRPSARLLRDTLQGRTNRVGLLALFRRHNADFGKLVGHGRSASTERKYRIALAHTERFVRLAYGRDDIATDEVDESFTQRLTAFLAAEGLAQGTVWLYASAVRRVTTLARRRGLLATDPFEGCRLSPAPSRRESLTQEEVGRLAALPLSGRAATVRDLFVLSCRTGLAYTDLRNLQAHHLKRETNGTCWIVKPRNKSGLTAMVRLTTEAQQLLKRLARSGGRDGGRLLPVPDNRTCNRQLKRLAQAACICRNVHFHLARHTFATLALGAGVPIESVSLMLGHSRLSTTQIYARVTTEKLRRDTECLMGETKGTA